MKKDNRGISLVELLVAVTMLVVIMTPMLNSFILSGRNNYKSRNLLRATTVANNLMESLEAFSLVEVCEQFNTNGNFKIYPQQPAKPENGEETVKMQYKELGNETETSGEVKVVDGNRQYTFKGTSDDKYYFVIKDIEEDGKYFDAKITLDASKYRVEDKADATEKEKKQNYNEQHGFDVDVMNSDLDAVLLYTLEEERIALGKIQEEYNNSNPGNKIQSVDSMIPNIKKKIYIWFEEYAGEDKAYQKVHMDIRYHYKNVEYDYGIFVDSILSDVRNIYVMIYPNYNSKQNKILDEIIIENNQENPYNLLLVKQIFNDTYFKKYYAGNTMEILEQEYWASLKIEDQTAAVDEIGQDGFVSNVRLRTNLTSNLMDEKSEKKYKNFKIEYIDKNNSTVCSYPAVNNDNTKMEELLQFVDGYPQNPAGEIQNDNLMYETIVEIYPEGTYEAGEMNEETRMVILNRK